MDVHTNIPLKNYLTMHLGGSARFMAEASSPPDLAALIHNTRTQGMPFIVIGGGSNIIAKDSGFDGLVIRSRIMGFDILGDTPAGATIKVGAGENWDEIVARSVTMGLSGIEAMSAIPGTAGAAPVQNVGAYGQEIADTLISLEAYDSTKNTFVNLSNNDCGFSYRHSIFRGEAQGRYVITSITLELSKTAPTPPFYAALQSYFDSRNVTLFTPSIIREAVIAIRSEKLPDPSKLPNTGSFFKNAIIDQWQLEELQKSWPDIPYYDLGDKHIKIPTGWLIEQAGYKGKLIHGMRVHDKNALVLINESATNYADLSAARDKIQGAVRDKFRIVIEQEPLEL